MFDRVLASLVDCEFLLRLFQTKPSITDSEDATPLALGAGSIVFDNVSFAYDGINPTLKHVTLTIPGGKTVGVCGETGGGKSTILKLILRFYDCSEGSISIDGQDIRTLQLERYVCASWLNL